MYPLGKIATKRKSEWAGTHALTHAHALRRRRSVIESRSLAIVTHDRRAPKAGDEAMNENV